MKHTCQGCGFKGLTKPPYDHEICPCCDFQFGFDDYEMHRQDGSYLDPSENLVPIENTCLLTVLLFFSPDCYAAHLPL
ncbi:hypothetical protein [Bacillus tequilensis]|uniref:Cysteine-rich CPCC domain-containing protein n=1 Tax=Bacillus tequilensis TaxID=227866 RepID=A0A6H0WCX9_9BACI|nr:hypothetical protein [Bacillus tequilensis]QIW78371.1 hypothetical protein G4P54_05360 [Bacillus tequilensis]